MGMGTLWVLSCLSAAEHKDCFELPISHMSRSFLRLSYQSNKHPNTGATNEPRFGRLGTALLSESWCFMYCVMWLYWVIWDFVWLKEALHCFVCRRFQFVYICLFYFGWFEQLEKFVVSFLLSALAWSYAGTERVSALVAGFCLRASAPVCYVGKSTSSAGLLYFAGCICMVLYLESQRVLTIL